MTSFEDFPVISLMPKKETGVISFLTKNPEYDGRGTTIVILDSGVDPGALGLQVTSDGKRKITHRFDCSGAGDVSTTTVVQPTDGYITGLTGRKLKIPETWNNPTNNYRIGTKHAFHLYPDKLEKDMKQKYLDNHWNPVQREVLGKTRTEVGFIEDSKDKDKLKKDNLESSVEMLKELDKKLQDYGPVYDCVLFHDGEMWRCCVDSTEMGDLKDCPLLGEYSKTGDYAPLTKESNLNFTFNVHNDGDTLELVGLCSTHGTLVAAIAAANFPDKPEENGIAPGAQIISLAIGDCRLGSMETGTGLVRAMIKMIELGETENIRVINMSYGEHAHWADSGRLGELMSEIVDKYGYTWVVSAGNHGPALNTVGSPPDMTQEVFIGVGAYVSPDMMLAGYSMRQKLPGMLYTWSSRGPTIDGAMGVTVCAPGGAVTSLPNYTLTYSQLCNGTSMSSPHTAGAISLLISGLQKMGIPYTPYSIKRAIEECATYLKDVEVFAQGSGLLNVEKTFDHLVANHRAKDLAVRFRITCGTGSRKGIYRRNKLNFSSFSEQVTIEPYFLNTDRVSPEDKLNFNLRLALTCEASYVNAPKHLDLSNMSRTIHVKVDTEGLEPGVHSTFVKAYDLSNVEKGVLFKIPVIIIIPQILVGPKYSLKYTDVHFEPNTLKRHFIHVPEGATWLKLSMSTKSEEHSRIVVHVLQILPRKSCKTIDSYKIGLVNSQKDALLAFKVVGGSTVEVVIAKTWNELGNIKLDYSLKFRGIKPNQSKIVMNAADGILGLELKTLRGDEILPSITLNCSTLTIRPSEAKISALTSRDLLPNRRQIYQLVLVYNFSVSKTVDITPNLASLSDLLYESEFESQLWMLYDSNKQLLACGDAYPSKYSKKIDKGDYVIRVQVRHEKAEYLEKLSEIPILIQQKLSSNVSLDVYYSYRNALIAGKKAVTHYAASSEVLPIYIAPLATDKLPKIAGQYISGHITFAKDELGKAVDTYEFKYIPVEGSTKKNGNGTNGNGNGNNGKNKQEQLNEQIRDLKIQMLLKMDQPTAEKLFEDLCTDDSAKTCVTLYTNYLTVLDPLDPSVLPPFKKGSEDKINLETLSKVVAICDKVIGLIDSDALLINAALKTDVKADSSKSKRLETQKNSLIDALARKGIASCRLKLKNSDDPKISEQLLETYKSLGRFIDLGDASLKSLPPATNVWHFVIWHSFVHQAFGKCFKLLWKLQEEHKNKKIEEKLIELCVLNEWTHVEQFLTRMLPSKFCEKYEPF